MIDSTTCYDGTGLFVTNQMNLMFSLAAGLIMPPSGFGDKYYQDTLAAYPGWTPVFVGKVPKSAIDFSTEEVRHLMPVIAELDLTDLHGIELNVARTRSQQLSLIAEPSHERSRQRGLLIRGPISANRIRLIRVKSDEDLDKIISQSQLRSNVPLRPAQLKRKKILFSRAYKRWEWQPESKWPQQSISVQESQAAGGILAMLFWIASKDRDAAAVCRSAFDPKSTRCDVPGLIEWMDDGHVMESSESVGGHLLWSIVTVLAENRLTSSDNDLDELVLHVLENVPAGLRNRTARLRNSLRSIGELGGESVGQLLKKHSQPVERAAILFFRRRQCQQLLDFESNLMTTMDWVCSAILFGARSGWLRLPLILRGNREMESAITRRMAAHAHRLAKTGVNTGAIPEMPPLRALSL